MAKIGGYTIENTYQGGYSSLDPNKAYSNSFTGYRTNVGSLGITTNPNTANQLKEVSDKLSSGLKNIEVELLFPNIIDAIPTQHFTEMRQLGKLTGGDISVHGPVIDPSGMGNQGFDEMGRQYAEKKITETLLRSHELNPDGNITVNFHTSVAPKTLSSEWETLGSVDGTQARQAKRIIGINRETGELIKEEYENKYYPGTDLSKPKKHTPEKNLEIRNESRWDNQINQLFFHKEKADQILGENSHLLKDVIDDLNTGKIKPETLSPTQQIVLSKYKEAELYLQEVNKGARNFFSQSYEYGNEEQREKLRQISDEFKREISPENNGNNPYVQSIAMRNLLRKLQDPELAPKMFVPIEEFALEKSSQTYGNAAFNVFNKFKDVNKAPIILIENPPAGDLLSTGEDLKNVVLASRKQFVERAVAENKMSKKDAEKTAEKLIGATWDVGHINMLRGKGFKEEDLIKETEKVAPFIRHVHLSDNFGFEHTELPMGMGNVPLKEMMARLGEKGFEGKKIIEAGDWWTQFKTSPVKEALEGLGSPMYISGPGPYWNQSMGLQQNYFSGYGMMLPSNHYQTFGAGFSQLPQELGGDIRSGTGRFSQRGME